MQQHKTILPELIFHAKYLIKIIFSNYRIELIPIKPTLEENPEFINRKDCREILTMNIAYYKVIDFNPPSTGDYKTALKYAEQALPLAPDANNKNNLTTMIDKLKSGKDVN